MRLVPLHLEHVRISLVAVAIVFALASCGSKNKSDKPDVAADYNPRLGIAVKTGARTCVALQNSTLQPNAPVTLIFQGPPAQSFQATSISGPSDSPCPITQETNPMMHSYDIASVPAEMPKLMPVIAIVGPPGSLTTVNGKVQSDLDQNGKTESFRTCGSDNGIHLTVWKGDPLTGTIVWHGYYYEPGNPGTLPTCTAPELGGH